MKKDELKSCDGKDGHPAYVVYNGKIYDLTKSSLWKDGIHMGRHRAGGDLTDFLSMAPHGPEVFKNLEPVGNIEEEQGVRATERMDFLRDLYHKYHPHPILIHFPIALFIFGAIMQFVFFLTKNGSFEHAAFYAILFAAFGLVFSIASGMFSWWVNYDMTLTTIFKNKVGFSIVLLLSAIFLIAARFSLPNISIRSDSLSYVYNALIFINVPVTIFIGYNGGKITWPS